MFLDSPAPKLLLLPSDVVETNHFTNTARQDKASDMVLSKFYWFVAEETILEFEIHEPN